MKVMLKMALITVDRLQARAATDQETVKDYAERMMEGEKFPPVVVFREGNRFFLADGFHRYYACVKNGFKDIEAEVRDGNARAALWYAVGANKAHGLKRSNADKRRAVRLALAERPELSDRAIAEHCGVNRNLVGEIRQQVSLMTPEGSVNNGTDRAGAIANIQHQTSNAEHRTGLDGKQYPARRDYGPPPVPGKKKTGGGGQGEAWSVEQGAPAFTDSGVAVSAKPVGGNQRLLTSSATVVRDKVGREIPDCCLGLWQRASEVQEQLTLLSRLKGMLRRAQEEQDPLYAMVNFSTILPHLEQAWTELKTALPYVVCSSCQGHETTRAGCRLCRGRGMISEFHWDRCVPEETKRIIRAGVGKGVSE